MFFEFHFWRYFFNRGYLLENLAETETIRGLKKRVGFVLMSTILLYILMNIWGMTTTSLTSLYVLGFLDSYAIARWISILGIVLWALLYFSFHFFGVSQLLHILTKIPIRFAAIMQLYVIATLLIEKAVLFFVFALLGYSTHLSFLSFGPLAAQFLDQSYFHYFFNQFSVFTGVVIAIQLQFLRRFTTLSTPILLAILLGMTAIFAAVVALVSVLPIDGFLSGGGF
ncbi:hypothetical protein MKY84_04640 [Chryseomicrobium sp. FSL W7-1435]|uniref:hypothetical protein n=1 Tax=Chryseomicrobium sp. FSL W7-1435 TaxID=2921704 RepID=UPI00315A4545